MSKFYERYKAKQEQKRIEFLEEEEWDKKRILIRSVSLFGGLERCRKFVNVHKLIYGERKYKY